MENLKKTCIVLSLFDHLEFMKSTNNGKRNERVPSFLKAAEVGYEIPAHLYSLSKPTRNLIAKAIDGNNRSSPWHKQLGQDLRWH